MADHNGSGNGVATEEAVTAAAQADPWSPDGVMAAGPQDQLADRPELLLGAALLGGLLLAALVSRIGS
jgi:hypothetical protein